MRNAGGVKQDWGNGGGLFYLAKMSQVLLLYLTLLWVFGWSLKELLKLKLVHLDFSSLLFGTRFILLSARIKSYALDHSSTPTSARQVVYNDKRPTSIERGGSFGSMSPQFWKLEPKKCEFLRFKHGWILKYSFASLTITRGDRKNYVTAWG